MNGFHFLYDEDYPIGTTINSNCEYNHPDVGFITIRTCWWKYPKTYGLSNAEFATINTSKVIYSPAICLDVIERMRCEDGKPDKKEIERNE